MRFVLLLLSLFLFATANAEPTPDERLNQFLDQVFERRVADSPMWESYLGRKTERQGQWDDFSDAHAEDSLQTNKADLARMQQQFDRDALGAQARVSYDLFVYETERAVANHAFRDHFYVVDQFNGRLSGLITLLKNNHNIDTVQDAEDYLSRIRGLETVLKEFTQQLEARAAAGVRPPSFAFPDVIADATAMSSGAPLDDGKPNAVYADFTAKLAALDASEADKKRLLEAADAALQGPFQRGFAGLVTALKRVQPDSVINRGVWSLPRGAAFYANRVAQHTTLDITADEVHRIGLAEVARLQEQMREIMAEVKFEGDLQAFFEFIRNDPNNYYADSDAGRAAFLADARKLVADIQQVAGIYFNQLPEAGLEVRRVEPWRENSVSIAFYNSPSQDGSRPGIYYANLADMKSVQKYVFTAITYHESVPGHHFQIALAQEMDDLPMFRRFGGHGAYLEGWALYAEKLAKEMGFYAEPLHNFGRLQNELWRAARLVIDTGIHAKKWTREQAIEYFRSNTPLSAGDIVTEVERFFVNPGQALSYKMGMNQILDLRQRAQNALGDDFDIREFHDVMLGSGSVPLPMLEQLLDAYLAEQETKVSTGNDIDALPQSEI